ncbi:MAG: DUF4339 domain-containing protein [Bacteroidales bacterium]|nr:DUF4339 domain-containing protein [Bacteroidales bacterium]
MKLYYYAENDQQYGPFTLEEIKSKRLKKSVLIWTEGMNNWEQANALEELKGFLISEPPPLPISNNKVIENKVQIKKESTKYVLSYKKESDKIVLGIFIFLIPIIYNWLIISNISTIEYLQIAQGIFALINILIRIFVATEITKSAKRQNRNETAWGFFAFFFPALSLIIIGFLRKLKLKIAINKNLPLEKHEKLLKKINDIFINKRYTECIDICNLISRTYNKESSIIYKYRGISFYNIEKYDLAENDLMNIKTSKKYSAEANYYLGNIEIKKFNREKAIIYWEKAFYNLSKYYYRNLFDKIKIKLDIYQTYIGKYILSKTEATKKLNIVKTYFNYNDFKKPYLKNIEGINQIDNFLKSKSIKISIDIYIRGININIKIKYRTLYIAIIFFEIIDIKHSQNKKQIILKLIDQTDIKIYYDKTKNTSDFLGQLVKNFNNETGRVPSAMKVSQ